MKRVLFRSDGSVKHGLGHLSRSLNLAEGFFSLGYKVDILTFDDEATKDFLNKKSKKVVKHLFSKKYIDEKLLEMANKYDLVFLDSYTISSKQIEKLHKFSKTLVAVDDHASKPLDVDIVVNGNIYASDLDYADLTQAHILSGPRFSLINPIYNKFHMVQKEISKKIKKSFVILGSAEEEEILDKVIEGIKKFSKEIKISVSTKLNKRYGDLEIVPFRETLAQDIFESDLVVSASGVTASEVLSVGTPGIFIITVDNQLLVGEKLKELGFDVLKRMEITPQKISNLINTLNVEKRQKLSKVGKELVDGLGVQRVASYITSFQENNVYLRSADKSDLYDLWVWRNDRVTRDSSINQDWVSFDDHASWFKSSLKNKERYIYIIMRDLAKAGMLRLDKEKQKAEISVNIAPEFRGHGIAKKSLIQMENKSASLGFRLLTAKIKASNLASLKLFKNLGYKEVSSKEGVLLYQKKL